MSSKSYLSRVVCDPIDELGDFREDSGHSSAGRRTERNDADHVKSSVAVTANQRSARITLIVERRRDFIQIVYNAVLCD